MNVPTPPLPSIPAGTKIPLALALVAIAFMVGAYLLFLWASWQQYQSDRRLRDDRIDELLSRLPQKTVVADGE